MSADLAVGTPLATALQGLVQPKLAENGWATGGLDDSNLAEYIVLMLANGKTQEEIATELSTDLLDLGPNNPDAAEFAHWLFEQVNVLQNGGQQTSAVGAGAENTSNNDPSSAPDAEMGDAMEGSSGTIPTGPKAMRNGNTTQKPRDKRMLNQLNKALDRSDDSALHRVRGTSGTGRINAHSREPPKGPRSQQIGRGIAAMANGRGMGPMGPMGGMNNMNMNTMNGMPSMPGMPMPQMGPNGPMGQGLNPQQQMMLLQMYESQAQLMQQLFAGNGQQPSAFVNPNFQGNRNGSGKSMFDRVDKSSKPHGKQQMHQSTKFTKKDNQDENMADSTATAENGDSAMDVEGSRPDASQTMCKFNLTCTRPDCIFVHQSPAAPPGIAVDMTDTCSFGVACMNKKCAGKHPSPAQKDQHKGEVDCIYWPNCRDQFNCPYKHPTMPPCRNGPDCTVPNCKFTHKAAMCKFKPCTNKFCRFKHEEGQKKQFETVWTAPKDDDAEKKDHVSERKFIDESAEEEVILPGRSNQEAEVML